MPTRSAERAEVAPERVTEQVRALGVCEGDVLLVHTSYRAIGPVRGGPLGLIAALRAAAGTEGTLVMPSWSGDEDVPFDPLHSPAAADLGAVADIFWHQPGVLRSGHAQAFAAAGPAAQQIIADPLPLPPHIPNSPVGRVHDLDGRVLLLGVGHDADTTLHLAELLADVPYRVARSLTVWEDGRPVHVEYEENDHCCERFALADEWLRAVGAQAEGTVGHGHARLARSRDIVVTALEHLARDPLVFLHPAGAGCADCDEARRSL